MNPRNERQSMKAKTPFLAQDEATPCSTSETRPFFPGGWLFGTVLAVEPAHGLLFLRSERKRKNEAIHWMAETQFSLDCHPASSADLRPGQRVRIHCRFANHEWQADSIAIGSYDQIQSRTLPRLPERPIANERASI
jgi:hypothetical protein